MSHRASNTLRLGGALLLGLLVAVPAPALEGSEPRRTPATREPDDLRARRQAAIREGCAFLARKQRTDGGFGGESAIVALTSLSVLALMAGGSTDGRGRHGRAVHKGVSFLITLIDEPRPHRRYPPGYFWYGHDNSSRMHGQGFATQALATALGTARSDRARKIRRVLTKAVACIKGAQATTGGFGYKPTPGTDHEGSVTVAVAQGLRAAYNAGILVDDQVIQRGLHYLKRSQKADGSFRYSLHRDRSSYALTAAALSSFFLYGKYADDEDGTISRGLAYLQEHLDDRGADVGWYYYGHYYAAWALWQWDGGDWTKGKGKHWASWQAEVYPDLLDRQRKDGAFETKRHGREYGPVLSTAFAVLTLAIPDERIPIFQR